jgi:hypothetical protein
MRPLKSIVYNQRLPVWESAWRRGPWADVEVATPRKSIAFSELLAAKQRDWRVAWYAEIKAAAKSRLDIRDGDLRLVVKRRIETEEEFALLLVEIPKAAGAKRSGGKKQLRVEMRDALIRQFLRIARADLRSGESKWNITAIVDEAAEHYCVTKSYAWDRLKEVDAELPSSGFTTCFAVNVPSTAGVGVSEDDAIKMRARGWTEEAIARCRRARRPWGDP